MTLVIEQVAGERDETVVGPPRALRSLAMPHESHAGRRHRAGFTSLELLAAIVVVGLLAVIAMAVYLGQWKRAWVPRSWLPEDAATEQETWITDNPGGRNSRP
ncbi:hypothetical protein A7K94_0201715 [Modestobacter sp. VKM Ac-2676]|nr:hypothetical protein A7K94_0201715 [Modestobacter sp. VKM Ac-2676]